MKKTSSGSTNRWEYKKESHLFTPRVEHLNALGRLGWEMVDVKHCKQPWSSVYTFKRLVAEDSPNSHDAES